MNSFPQQKISYTKGSSPATYIKNRQYTHWRHYELSFYLASIHHALVAALLAIVPLFVYPRNTYADAYDCNACIKKARLNCGPICDGSKSRDEFDICSDNCAAKVCQQSCPGGTPSSAALSKNPLEQCRGCRKALEANGCTDECDAASPSFLKCKKQCIQDKCASYCDLPDSGDDDAKPKGKYDCEICRDRAERLCKTAPECAPGQPGAVACAVNCVQKACESKCSE